MRIHNRGFGFRRRLGVTTRIIIGGLLVLLMLAVAACNDAEPNATVEPTVPSSAQVATPKPSVTAPPSPLPVAATDVETVYVSPAAAINGSATTRIAEYVNLRLIPTLLRLHECNYYSNVVKADEPY